MHEKKKKNKNLSHRCDDGKVNILYNNNVLNASMMASHGFPYNVKKEISDEK